MITPSTLWEVLFLGFVAGIPMGVCITLACQSVRERRDRVYRDWVRRRTWFADPSDNERKKHERNT